MNILGNSVGGLLPTPAQIGAAPAGFGLGEDKSRWVNNPDTALQSGWYRTETPYSGWMRVDAYATTHLTQTIYLDSYAGCAIQRTRHGGAFGEWEHVNPPMKPGVEYRTTERINGKAVYKRKINDASPIQYRLDGEIAWHAYSLLNGVSCYLLSVAAQTTRRFTIEGTMLMMGRLKTGNTGVPVYVLSSYYAYRPIIVVELSKGTYTVVATGGDSTNGYYIDVSNTSEHVLDLYIIGAYAPMIIE